MQRRSEQQLGRTEFRVDRNLGYARTIPLADMVLKATPGSTVVADAQGHFPWRVGESRLRGSSVSGSCSGRRVCIEAVSIARPAHHAGSLLAGGGRRRVPRADAGARRGVARRAVERRGLRAVGAGAPRGEEALLPRGFGRAAPRPRGPRRRWGANVAPLSLSLSLLLCGRAPPPSSESMPRPAAPRKRPFFLLCTPPGGAAHGLTQCLAWSGARAPLGVAGEFVLLARGSATEPILGVPRRSGRVRPARDLKS